MRVENDNFMGLKKKYEKLLDLFFQLLKIPRSIGNKINFGTFWDIYLKKKFSG